MKGKSKNRKTKRLLARELSDLVGDLCRGIEGLVPIARRLRSAADEKELSAALLRNDLPAKISSVLEFHRNLVLSLGVLKAAKVDVRLPRSKKK